MLVRGYKCVTRYNAQQGLITDQLFNLEFQFGSGFYLEFQPKFGIQLGIPIPMGINLGECVVVTEVRKLIVDTSKLVLTLI